MSIFEKWNLETSILDAIKSRGWTEPTEIQIDAIPFARKGRDIVGPVSYTHLTLPTTPYV